MATEYILFIQTPQAFEDVHDRILDLEGFETSRKVGESVCSAAEGLSIQVSAQRPSYKFELHGTELIETIQPSVNVFFGLGKDSQSIAMGSLSRAVAHLRSDCDSAMLLVDNVWWESPLLCVQRNVLWLTSNPSIDFWRYEGYELSEIRDLPHRFANLSAVVS